MIDYIYLNRKPYRTYRKEGNSMDRLKAYEFTKFIPNDEAMNLQKNCYYDVDTIELQITYNNPNWDYKQDEDYLECKDVFMDVTGSCNTEEALKWMEYFMAKAIAYGIQKKDLSWRTKFLAARSIFNDLVVQKKGGGI